MMVASFTLFGEPRGKGRPRFARGKKFVQVFTDKDTLKYEQALADAGREAMGDKPPTDQPVSLQITICAGVPKSWSKKRSEQALNKVEFPKKPDADNVAKIVMDALNGVCYVDDVQVVRLIATKSYSNLPRIDIEIREYLP